MEARDPGETRPQRQSSDRQASISASRETDSSGPGIQSEGRKGPGLRHNKHPAMLGDKTMSDCRRKLAQMCPAATGHYEEHYNWRRSLGPYSVFLDLLMTSNIWVNHNTVNVHRVRFRIWSRGERQFCLQILRLVGQLQLRTILPANTFLTNPFSPSAESRSCIGQITA